MRKTNAKKFAFLSKYVFIGKTEDYQRRFWYLSFSLTIMYLPAVYVAFSLYFFNEIFMPVLVE